MAHFDYEPSMNGLTITLGGIPFGAALGAGGNRLSGEPGERRARPLGGANEEGRSKIPRAHS